MEQVAGPGDGARDSRQIPDNGGRSVLLFILLLDVVDLLLVVGEQNVVLLVEVVL